MGTGEVSEAYSLELPVYLAKKVQQARFEMERTETPWEPFRELAAVIADAPAHKGYLLLTVPWRLLETLRDCTQEAKNLSSSRNAQELIPYVWRMDKAIETRSAVDRLSDLVDA